MSRNILPVLLDEKIRETGLSEREVSRQTGISATTIGRARKGESVDIDTLVRLCDWLGVVPSHVLDSMLPEVGPESLTAAIAAVIEMEPELGSLLDAAVNRVLSGEMDPNVLRELTAYAAWRLGGVNNENSEGES